MKVLFSFVNMFSWLFYIHYYTVYNKTCQLQRCLSKNESRSELSAIPFLSGNKLSSRKSFDRSRQTNHNTFESFHRLLCRWCPHHIYKWHLHGHFTWWKIFVVLSDDPVPLLEPRQSLIAPCLSARSTWHVTWGNSCIRRIFIVKMSITPKTWHFCCKMLSF